MLDCHSRCPGCTPACSWGASPSSRPCRSRPPGCCCRSGRWRRVRKGRGYTGQHWLQSTGHCHSPRNPPHSGTMARGWSPHTSSLPHMICRGMGPGIHDYNNKHSINQHNIMNFLFITWYIAGCWGTHYFGCIAFACNWDMSQRIPVCRNMYIRDSSFCTRHLLFHHHLHFHRKHFRFADRGPGTAF